MSVDVKITIKNLPQIKYALSKAPKTMTRNLRNAIKKSTLRLHADARNESPKKTGQLSRTHALSYNGLTGMVWPTVHYALPVHEGHRQQVGRFVPAIGKRLKRPFVKGQPWLVWAKEKSEPQIQQYFEEAVTNTLNEIERDAR